MVVTSFGFWMGLDFFERGFGSGLCPDGRGVADWCGFFLDLGWCGLALRMGVERRFAGADCCPSSVVLYHRELVQISRSWYYHITKICRFLHFLVIQSYKEFLILTNPDD